MNKPILINKEQIKMKNQEKINQLIAKKTAVLNKRIELFHLSLKLDDEIAKLQPQPKVTSSFNLFSRDEIYNDFR